MTISPSLSLSLSLSIHTYIYIYIYMYSITYWHFILIATSVRGAAGDHRTPPGADCFLPGLYYSIV